MDIVILNLFQDLSGQANYYVAHLACGMPKQVRHDGDNKIPAPARLAQRISCDAWLKLSALIVAES
jgi:hypothetical protein